MITLGGKKIHIQILFHCQTSICDAQCIIYYFGVSTLSLAQELLLSSYISQNDF